MGEKRTGILSKGEIIDDTYEVQFFIGEGAFGEVYRVHHKYLGTQVLKVLKESYAETTDLEIITREAKILSTITHPNIVRVFETNRFEKNNKYYYYMTMGFVSGEPLAHLLQRKPKLPLPIALSIAKDFLSGLQTAHDQDPPIIHRDISADNILLSYDKEKPVALLSDFGLAQSIDQLSQIPGAGGKYPYLAQECFWNVYLKASDVFAAGIVLYNMVAGMHPWEYNFEEMNDDHDKISTMILSARKKPPCKPSDYADDCSEHLDNVILKAISLDIENRFKTASEFLAALTSGTHISSSVTTSTDEQPSEKHSPARIVGKGFDEIAGMQEIKDTLYHDVIAPLNDRELYEQYKVTIPNGMLLYGPPGCGKTFISQKFSEEVGYNYVEVRPSDLASTYIHGTQQKIGKLFRDARKKAPTIIFIDEIDALIPSREGKIDQGYASEVNEFLAQMTECNKDGIFLIIATNRPEKIDPALLRTGRIDKVIYVGLPDYEARKKMFQLFLKDRPAESSIDIEKLVKLTEGYVSSDIKFMVNEAARNALMDRTNITQNHLEKVIKATKPSISQEELNRYEVFKNKRHFV